MIFHDSHIVFGYIWMLLAGWTHTHTGYSFDPETCCVSVKVRSCMKLSKRSHQEAVNQSAKKGRCSAALRHTQTKGNMLLMRVCLKIRYTTHLIYSNFNWENHDDPVVSRAPYGDKAMLVLNGDGSLVISWCHSW